MATERSMIDDVQLAQHIIEFDPSNPETYAPWTELSPATLATTHPALQPIPWPEAEAPRPRPLSATPQPASSLPQADYLVVTWTVAEAQALADVLTPGHPSFTWYPYAHFFSSHYEPDIRPGAPASKAKRLGTYFPLTIGARKVLCFKSELHLSQDGVKLPVRKLWHQILAETRARVVITTGTAGAIGRDVKLGDVVLGRTVRFHCSRMFAHEPFNAEQFASPLAVPLRRLETATQKLLPVNAGMLPEPHHRLRLYYDGSPPREAPTVVTTDFFAFDNSVNTYKLQGLGAAVEMGDAVLGLVCRELGSVAPGWLAIRNASDPQIDGTLPLDEQKRAAARIYERYGYWTTVGSAIATWAVIAGSV